MANQLRHLSDDFRRRLQSALQNAQRSRIDRNTRQTVVRRNAVVSTNVGQEGSTATVVAAQVAPIRQKGSDSRQERNRP